MWHPMLDSCRDVAVSGLLLTNLRRRFGGQLYTPLGGLRVAGELDAMYVRLIDEEIHVRYGDIASGDRLMHLPWLPADQVSGAARRQIELGCHRWMHADVVVIVVVSRSR